MIKPPIPVDENDRLDDLRRLDLLLATPEEAFDAVTDKLARGDGVEVVEHDNELLLFLDRDLEYTHQTDLQLARGDRLLLHTDGAIEAVDPEGNRLDVAGFSRHVEAVVRERPADWLESLLARLSRFAGDRLDDDVALLGITSSA